MLIWIILLAVLAAYVLFIVAPSLAMYAAVFGRKPIPPMEEAAFPQTYFDPYRDRIEDAMALLRSLPRREVWITSHDGLRLFAEYFDSGASRTVIFFHGYSSSPYNNFAVQCELFTRAGFNLLLVHQRAHGRSEGRHLAFGLHEQYDVLSWADWAAAQPGCEAILLYGTSMGCATVAYASDKLQNEKVRAMMLDCGYASPFEQMRLDSVKRHLPWRLMLPIDCLCARLFLGIDLKTPAADALRRTAVPALFLGGTEDTTVPVEQVLRNYDACASPKEAIITEGAAHTVALLTGGEQAERRLMDFIGRYF